MSAGPHSTEPEERIVGVVATAWFDTNRMDRLSQHPEETETYDRLARDFLHHLRVIGHEVVPTRPAVSRGEEETLLRAIASQIRGWLAWSEKTRTAEGLSTDGETAIMSIPVPMWPNHRQLTVWAETIEAAAWAHAMPKGSAP